MTHQSWAVREFEKDVTSILEPDYGDFMRRAGSYLRDLQDRLGEMNSDVENKVDEMRDYLMFHATWEIEMTRDRLLMDAEELRAMFEAEDLGDDALQTAEYRTPREPVFRESDRPNLQEKTANSLEH